MTQKGQGLIETIIALSAAVLIISALAMVVLSAVGNSDYTRIQNQATAYAQEELEALKDMSKNDWNNFNAYDGTYCPSADLNLGTRISGNCQTQCWKYIRKASRHNSPIRRQYALWVIHNRDTDKSFCILE